MMYTLVLRPRRVVEAEELDALLEEQATVYEEEAERIRLEAEYERLVIQEAERIRCLHINTACGNGEVIVNNRYYEASNPLWRQLAEEQCEGLDCRPAASRHVETCFQDYTMAFLESQQQVIHIKTDSDWISQGMVSIMDLTNHALFGITDTAEAHEPRIVVAHGLSARTTARECDAGLHSFQVR